MLRLKLKHSQVAPVRTKLMQQQGGVCYLCQRPFKGTIKPALDHDHNTGFIRDTLCLNCNRAEGEIANRANRAMKGEPTEFLRRLLAYYERHETPQHGGLIHPTHLTETEKRIARNAKARAKRAALKKE